MAAEASGVFLRQKRLLSATFEARRSALLFLHYGDPCFLRGMVRQFIAGYFVHRGSHSWLALRQACPTTLVLGIGPECSSLISSIIDAISAWSTSSCQLK